MFAQATRKHMKWLMLAPIILILAVIFVSDAAFARVVRNTIDPVATVSNHGRHLIVTGPIQCTQQEKTFIRVTVTQRTTGAWAEGHTRIVCTEDIQQWEVHAVTDSKATFEEGPATAVAFARIVDRKVDITDTDPHQWLVNITLVEED
jgi:hypothetical protein